MRRLAFVAALLLPALALAAPTPVTISDQPVQVIGTFTSNGAADTTGPSTTISTNSQCAVVLLTGQPSPGLHIAAGTLGTALSASLSDNATPATSDGNGNSCPGGKTCSCTGGTYPTAAKFSDASGNQSATLSLTNPNAEAQWGITTISGAKCARVCSAASGTSGSAVLFLQATVAASPPPAAGADVTDRAARLLGVTYGSQGQQTKQSPTNFNAVSELAVGATLIDPRAIRALTTSDAITASQGGSWTVGLTGTVPLPTGAATSALQTTLNSLLPGALDGTGGLKTHEQGTVPVTGTFFQGTQPISAASLPLPTGAAADATLTGGTTKAIARGGAKGVTTAADVTSTAEGSDHQALDVQLWLAGSALDPRTRTWTLSSGTDSIAVTGTVGLAAGSQVIGHIIVDTAPTTVVTGAAGSTLAQDATLTGGTAKEQLFDGTNVIGTSAHPVRTDPTGSTSQPVTVSSGTVIATSSTAANLKGQMEGTQANGSTTIPNPVVLAGSDYAGTPAVQRAKVSSDGLVHVAVDSGGGTGGGPADAAASAAASESDAARQKVTTALRLLDTAQTAGSQLVSAKGDQTNGMWVNCKTGCAGSGGTSSAVGSAFPTTVTASGFSDGTNTQGARVADTDSGAGTHYTLETILVTPGSGGPAQAGTSSNPLRTDPTGSTAQPSSQSGTWSMTATQATGTNLHMVADTGSTTAATQATAANLNAQVQGAAASGASKSGNPVQGGAVFNTTPPTVTTGQAVENQATARGSQIVATGVDTFNATINTALPAGTNVIGHTINDSGSTTAVTSLPAIPTGSNTIGAVTAPGAVALAKDSSVTGLEVAQGSTTSGTSGILGLAAVSTSAPTLTTGTNAPPSMDTAGNLRMVWSGTGNIQGLGTAGAPSGGVLTVDPSGSKNFPITGSLTPADTAGTLVSLSAACSTGVSCAANTTALVQLAGQNSANVTFSTGSSPLMTVVADCAGDGGTAYQLTGSPSTTGVVWFRKSDGTLSQSIANPGNLTYNMVLPQVCSGATTARVRAAAVTSGTVNGQARAAANGQVSYAGAIGANSYPPDAVALMAQDSSTATTSRAVRADANGVLVSQATAANLNAQVQGPAANGASQSGNPVQESGVARATGAAPTQVTAGQVSALTTDLEHRLWVATEHPNGSSCIVDAASASTQCVGLSGASLSYYIKSVSFSASSAITFKVNSSTTAGNACATSPALVIPTSYMGANTGGTFTFPQPIKVTANSALCCLPSGASGSCIIAGYIAP